jgi:hypothetical protein
MDNVFREKSITPGVEPVFLEKKSGNQITPKAGVERRFAEQLTDARQSRPVAMARRIWYDL